MSLLPTPMYNESRALSLSSKKFRMRAGLTLVLALFFMLFTIPTSANAATMGAGFHGNPIPGLQLPHLGNWVTSDGFRAYCIEPGRNNPTDNQQKRQLTTSFPGYTANSLDHTITIPELSGTALARINYIVERWGDTSNNSQAAAVQIAIWVLRKTPETYLQKFYSVSAFSGTPSYKTTRDRAQGYVDKAIVAVPAAATGTPSVLIDLAPALPSSPRVDGTPQDSLPGTLKYRGGPGWKGELFINGGAFDVTGNHSSLPVNGNQDAAIFADRNTLLESASDINLSVSGTVTGYPAEGYLHSSITTGQQRLFTAAAPISHELSFRVETDRIKFSPRVSTSVTEKNVQVGERFHDRIIFSLDNTFVEPGTTLSSSWPKDDEGLNLPITARASLYYLPQLIPDSSNTGSTTMPSIPEHAERVFTTFFTTDPTKPSDEAYIISADNPADRAGTYSWVIEIHASDQPAWVQPYLPHQYRFVHEYGIPEETHTVPFELGLETQVSAEKVRFGDPFSDRVEVFLIHGPWIEDEHGNPINIDVVGRAYFVEEYPEIRDKPDQLAQEIAEFHVVVSGEKVFMSEELRAPAEEGFITFQWCVKADQDMVNAGHCDQWGLPHETVQIVAPAQIEPPEATDPDPEQPKETKTTPPSPTTPPSGTHVIQVPKEPQKTMTVLADSGQGVKTTTFVAGGSGLFLLGIFLIGMSQIRKKNSHPEEVTRFL